MYVDDIFSTNGAKETELKARCKPFEVQNSPLKVLETIQFFLRLFQNFNIHDKETINSLKNRTM